MNYLKPNCFEKTKEAWGIFSFFSSTNVETKNVCPIAYNYFIGATNSKINTKNQQFMIIQEIKATVIFEFKGLPIVMLSNKEIYHIEKQKLINEKLNCRSLGYWIDRRFYTKSKLNKLSMKSHLEIKVKEIIDCPF